MSERIAIVTGGSHGIGYAIAKRLTHDNYTVAIADINADASVLDLPLDRVFAVQVDVSDETSVNEMVRTIVHRTKRIDVLVNNAGVVGQARPVIASISGKEGNPTMAAYSASKAGMIGFTKALAKEVVRDGILVNCVTPAVIRTDMMQRVSEETLDALVSKIPMGRIGEPEEVAALVAWLSSDECSFSTGAVFDVSGGRATY